jgi:thimet oligopeptidase
MYDYTRVTADSVAAEADAALSRADALVDEAAASADSPTFDTTLQRLEMAGAEISVGYGRSAFMAQVHPDEAVRSAGQEAEERLTKWRVALVFRQDVYRAVAAFAATEVAARLEGEEQRLLEHWMRDFRRAGHELPGEHRKELEQLRSRLVELEVAFQRNLNEHRDWIDVDRQGLAGLPDDYVARLKSGERPGTYRVSLDYPEVQPFLELAHDRALREQLFRKNWNKAANENRLLLEEALRLRRRIAELLGHPTWADYALEVKMAGTPERVDEFYAELVPPLEQAAREEIAEMRRMAEEDGVEPPLQPWDWLYYDAQLSRERYGVDKVAISQYLPLDDVMAGMFELTGDVFGLRYREVPEPMAWHPSVRAYEILDSSSDELLARFYTDFFPREGKYGHAAAFPLVIEHRGPDGSRVVPVSAIVANFTAPSDEQPTLLTHGPHGEIETLWHEFGHILHMSLSQAQYVRFSGAETEWDFVEAPSQIMEHWVWQPEVLARFARHHRTSEPIPPDLVAKMAAARNINLGLRATRQVFFGKLDMAMHAVAEPPDLDEATRQTFAVTQLPYPEGTFMLSGFGHFMGGYDAGYYGYLWAEVIGDDMWSRFANEGITSSEVGRAYRQAILEPNGSRSGDELVEAFLGRAASVEGYMRMRNLSPVPAAADD